MDRDDHERKRAIDAKLLSDFAMARGALHVAAERSAADGVPGRASDDLERAALRFAAAHLALEATRAGT